LNTDNFRLWKCWGILRPHFISEESSPSWKFALLFETPHFASRMPFAWTWKNT